MFYKASSSYSTLKLHRSSRAETIIVRASFVMKCALIYWILLYIFYAISLIDIANFGKFKSRLIAPVQFALRS